MKIEITDRYLRALKLPASGRIEVSDTKRPGLRFRLSYSGHAVWMYEKRIKGGAKRKHTLGTWPEPVSLSSARALALELEAEAARGVDRVAVEESIRLADDRSQSGVVTVQAAIDLYWDLHLSTLKTGAERKRQLEQSLSKHLGSVPSSLSRSVIQGAIDAKAREGRMVSANRIRAALMAFSRWCWRRGYVPEDFGASVSSATRETARERVLSISEVREIWAATFKMGDLWGPIFRLLLLTAQRRGEILKLRQSEIEIERARIVKPGSLTKNGKAHITHLSNAALHEINALCDRLPDGQPSDLLFTTTGRTPVSGVSKAKSRLDRLLVEGFEPWRLHDIRTAFATTMAESGIPETIADRILNHSASGSAPSAVARVYNQAELLPQRADALDRWAMMVTQERGQVVTLGVTR